MNRWTLAEPTGSQLVLGADDRLRAGQMWGLLPELPGKQRSQRETHICNIVL